MFDSFLTKIFGSRNDRLIRQYRKRCAQINKLEPEIQALTDEQLRGKTAEFRERLDKGETLDALLPRLYAKPVAACWGCVISTCSLSAVWF